MNETKNKLLNIIRQNKGELAFFIYYVCLLNYFEILYKYFFNLSYISIKLFYIIIYSVLLTILSLLLKKNKQKMIVLFLITSFLSFFYFSEAVYFENFKTFALWNQIMRIGEFSKVFWATGVMINPQHFLYALPLLFYFCFAYFVYKKNPCFGTINIKLLKKFFFLIVCIGLLLFSSLSIVYNTQNSNKILIRNSIEFVEDYGLVDAFVVNSTYPLIKCFLPAEIEKNAIIEEKITYNREIHQYTNVYEDKNLIFILGESIAPYAIDQQLTPTLYKMKEEGKYFSNYYATRLNTLNSEYAVLNSFYLTPEREKSKFDSNGTMPKLFKNNGYTTQAFHDYDGAFYYRNMTMLEMGFDAFYDQHDLKTTGDFIDPSGDEEMFLRSFDYLSNKDPFFAFYITFSAHMPYNEEKRLSLEENLKIVKEVYPEYSESSQVYLASAMETDQGLDVLFTQMELEGILDNTVVAFVGDHYPYAISDEDLQKDFGVINDLNIYIKFHL